MNDQYNAQNRVEPLHQDQSVSSLVRQVATDASDLVTKEVALAKSEISESISQAKKGAISMVSGGSVLYAGLLVLLFAAVLGLAQVVELWLSALIVGGIVAIVGWIMVAGGKKKLEADSFTPERTAESLRRDKQALKGVTQ